LIRDSQHGFRRGRSCLTNLLTFLDKVTRAADEGHDVDAIYLDFAKAFDKVPHQRLLVKLRNLGIGGSFLRWIRDWLDGRRQRVHVGGRGSGWRRVTSGVPQGSVLGPLLFLVFINDLEEGVMNSVLKFVDDTKLFGIVENEGQQMQRDLCTIVEWSRTWQIEFVIDKCKILHIGGRNGRLTYSMEGRLLEEMEVEKDLGVMISQDLKASRYCQEVYSKVSRELGMMKRSIVFKTKDVLLPL
jgi:ribonucleases P/MRP protein subunit RPP40